MTSEGDPRDKESDDQSASDFGPPVGEFGPPVSEFGPPVSEFGPPMGDTGPHWQVSEQTGDHPELVWRPAADAGTTPPTPPQYRAPDSTSFPEPRPTPPPVPPRVPPVDREQDADKDSWWNRPTDTGSVPKPPPLTSPGLSWADDPIAKMLAPTTPVAPPPPPRRSGSHTGRNVIAGILAVVILIGLTVTVILVSKNNGGDNPAPPGVSPSAALSCPATKDGKVTVGNGAGDTTTGPGAILGFQYAFYVERSGERARRFVAPDAENVSTAEIIQKGINEQVPVGTTHCVRITELATDTFDVDLTEHRPDGTTFVYPQTVTMVSRDGKMLVYAIKERRVS
ncbi:hypothetical protein ACQPW1_06785 [Nocardia sp. CA-128927]|uniref:hypothetical protein n=1 Tax=Nocardia sp. CA-128927 TaxID=3239975 RepID=UPI003D98D1FA